MENQLTKKFDISLMSHQSFTISLSNAQEFLTVDEELLATALSAAL